MIQHSTTAVREENLHVAWAGKNRSALLLRGWPEFRLTREPVITRLPDQFDKIVPDLHGCGGGDEPAGASVVVQRRAEASGAAPPPPSIMLSTGVRWAPCDLILRLVSADQLDGWFPDLEYAPFPDAEQFPRREQPDRAVDETTAFFGLAQQGGWLA